jgi:uncharacterized protein (DUF1501 family)
MQRRIFLKQGAFALVTMGLNPSFLQRTVLDLDLPPLAKGKTLICLFQRGAADALNVVVPFGDREYYALRPRIGIAAPSRGGARACSRPSMRWAVRVPRGRTSMRRTTWNRVRPTTRARATGGSTGISPRVGRAKRIRRRRRFAR